MENEEKLKESLIECDREKEDLERRCTVLEREKAEQSQTVGYDWLLLWGFQYLYIYIYKKKKIGK